MSISPCCVESVLLSLLFNPVLQVPDIARLKQLKERERATRANPFTAATFDIEKKKEKERKKAEKIEPNWKPTMATFSAPHELSTAAMALQGGKVVRRAAPPAAATADAAPPAEQHVPVSESVPVNEAPQEAQVPKPVPGDNIGTVLHRPVEPWRLVSSRAKKPISRRPKPVRPQKEGKKVLVL